MKKLQELQERLCDEIKQVYNVLKRNAWTCGIF